MKVNNNSYIIYNKHQLESITIFLFNKISEYFKIIDNFLSMFNEVQHRYDFHVYIK